mmetsp:Transcript_35153/g.98200  ORF Transcript_35153/g.98200 Transcript_35153/m.98200 type:complete len:164 (-) Transcript_35153:213-704(-)
MGPVVLRAVVHTLGRGREAGWESSGVAEYTRRLARGSPAIAARLALYPTEEALRLGVARVRCPVVVLDRGGEEQPSTEELAEILFSEVFASSSTAAFVIGGASGLPSELRGPAAEAAPGAASFRRLSLGRLTFPHRLTRLLLLEQLFRAREHRAGSAYHQADG